jgi:nucleoid-associated protein YgaU
MFLKNSRYAGLPTVTARDRSGREVEAVTLRRLPAADGDPVTVAAHDKLDAMSEARYGDATRYWHIADANSELEAGDLVREPGRVIAVPKA